MQYELSRVRPSFVLFVWLAMGLASCGGTDGGSADGGDSGAGSDGGVASDGGGVGDAAADGGAGPRPPTPSAFNVFDESTFAESTCVNLPIEVPEGVFVALGGRSDGAGTLADPIDLATAISDASPARPGQTIWIGEGYYEGAFVSEVDGESGSPVEVRPMPGTRVIIDSASGDGPALRINGSWTNYYGLETLSSDTNRGSIEEDDPDVDAYSGVAIFGANSNVYNMIVHDNVGGGIDFWKTAIDSTIHGNIIYNNGYSARGRGHGHGVYTQNTDGFKRVTNNIIFFGFQTGLHPYSTRTAPLNNFSVERNVWFLAGASDQRRSQQKTNCIISSPAGVRNLLMRENLGYSQVDRGTSLSTGEGDDIGASFVDNYLVERIEIYGNWGGIPFTGNTVYGNITDPDMQVNDVMGNTFESSRPSTGTVVFVAANEIDRRRGRVVIYNYDESPAVNVDLSSILSEGEAYRIHSVFGLFDAPLISGVYDGAPVAVPMGTVSPPQPNGDDTGISDTDDPHEKFGTFIVTHGGCE